MDGDSSPNPSILKMRIPESLKNWLVDDWDQVTRQHKLALLPAKLTVTQITDNFIAHMKSGKALSEIQESSLTTSIYGFKTYFDKMVGPQLLYDFEKPQYSQIIEDYPGIAMSDVYGSIHMLRLFTRMELITCHATMDEHSLNGFMKYMQQLLKYIISKRAALFSLLDYGNAPPEYLAEHGSVLENRRDVYAHTRKSKSTTK